MIFGSITFSADAACSQRLYRFLSNGKIECHRISEEGGRVVFTVGVESSREIKAFLTDLNCEYEIISEHGPLPRIRMFLKRRGLIFGALVCTLLIVLLSDVVLVIDVSADLAETRQAVLDVLSENGIRPGSRLGDKDLTVIERIIKSRVDGVAWVGISVDGNRLVIDTLEYTPKPEFTVHRLPSNIVAAEDGVIDKVELLDGQLLTPAGSGVSKGDVLISGKVVTNKVSYDNGKEVHDISTRYTRSIGSVYGTFERRVSFEQPFIEQTKAYLPQNEKNVWSISVFDVELPLNSAEGNYELVSADEWRPSIFGLSLPLALSKSSVREYSFSSYTYSAEQATAAAEAMAEKYERNILNAYEIRDKSSSIRETDSGVVLKVTYTLYGELGEERDFFIPK